MASNTVAVRVQMNPGVAGRIQPMGEREKEGFAQ